MSLHTLNIRLDFPYRTGFTHGAFRPENDALASLMEQRPGSRVLVLLEKGLEQFYPQLPSDIDCYFGKMPGCWPMPAAVPFRAGRKPKQVFPHGKRPCATLWKQALTAIPIS